MKFGCALIALLWAWVAPVSAAANQRCDSISETQTACYDTRNRLVSVEDISTEKRISIDYGIASINVDYEEKNSAGWRLSKLVLYHPSFGSYSGKLWSISHIDGLNARRYLINPKDDLASRRLRNGSVNYQANCVDVSPKRKLPTECPDNLPITITEPINILTDETILFQEKRIPLKGELRKASEPKLEFQSDEL